MASDVVSIEWSTEQFSSFLTEFANNVDIEAETFLKKMAFDLLSKVVARTPVRYGRARAGWSAAGKALGVDVPESENSMPGDSQYEEQFTSDVKLIRITNNVDYIIYLEYGSSKQAPLGMLRISMLELQAGQNTAIQELQNRLNEIWGGMKPAQRYTQQRTEMAGLLGRIPTGRLASTLNAVRAARRPNV